MIRDGKIKDGGGGESASFAEAGEDNRDIRSRDLAASTINH